MIEIELLLEKMREGPLKKWADQLTGQLQQNSSNSHGDMQRWAAAIDRMPPLSSQYIDLNSATVAVSSALPADQATLQKLTTELKELHPWRKGPFDIHGVYIDTEWHSDWKWDRVAPHISDLKGRTVLDVGCGNGYHCWRIAGAEAELVIGIDPTRLFLAQFAAIRKYIGNNYPAHLLPLGIEDVPQNLRAFDTVLSMGVLYHRRSPIDHILELKGCLRSGGELVLETLVVDGGQNTVFVPQGRYAKMRNVWFLPSPDTLVGWLQRCGFHSIEVADISITTEKEQRSTEWMHFESLCDYLNPEDQTLTIEGHPAPKRATIIATSK